MRSLKMDELSSVNGGEMTCTLSVGTNTSASCTGTGSEWLQVGQAVWAFLSLSPFTVPGIITRLK